jgi:hypothetical protein
MGKVTFFAHKNEFVDFRQSKHSFASVPSSEFLDYSFNFTVPNSHKMGMPVYVSG